MNIDHEVIKMNPPFLCEGNGLEEEVHQVGLPASCAAPEIDGRRKSSTSRMSGSRKLAEELTHP